MVEREKLKRQQKLNQVNSFETTAREFLKLQSKSLKPKTIQKKTGQLELHIFPEIGHYNISDIDEQTMLSVLRRIEKKDRISTVHIVKHACSQIFRFAISEGKAMHDPCVNLKGALTPYTPKHHASITNPAQIGELLNKIEEYKGDPNTKSALMLMPLVFLRSAELRGGRWDEIDFDSAVWRVPADRMKMNKNHLIPLSDQSIDILERIKPLTYESGLLFPGLRNKNRPIAENSLNTALRKIGYGHDEMTIHGFRSMASTRLHEMGWRTDIIELQLSHKEGNQVKAAYNYAEHLPERIKMMQAWADYLDQLRLGGSVVAIGFKQK